MAELGAYGLTIRPTTHAGVRSHLDADGRLVHEGYCSCRHVTDPKLGYGARAAAARELVDHLDTCPDESLVVDVSLETEAWAERFPDQTCTLDEWRERYG